MFYPLIFCSQENFTILKLTILIFVSIVKKYEIRVILGTYVLMEIIEVIKLQ